MIGLLKNQKEIEKLPTLEERDEALQKLQREYVEYKDRIARGYEERLEIIEASPVSQELKDVELAKLENTHDVALKKAAEIYEQELKRVEDSPIMK